MPKPHRIRVVAGLMESNGKLLIAQRNRSHRDGLKWEFPGGKMEKGESAQAALVRELKEELGIEAEIGPELARYEYAYPDGITLLLIFLRVSGFRGSIGNGFFEQIRWEERNNLLQFDFLDGDRDFVRRLAAGEFR